MKTIINYYWLLKYLYPQYLRNFNTKKKKIMKIDWIYSYFLRVHFFFINKIFYEYFAVY